MKCSSAVGLDDHVVLVELRFSLGPGDMNVFKPQDLGVRPGILPVCCCAQLLGLPVSFREVQGQMASGSDSG